MVINDQSEGTEELGRLEAYLLKHDEYAKNYQEERAALVKNLPAGTRRRISALKKLVKEYLIEDAKCDREIHTMVCQMHAKLANVYAKSEALVDGSTVPTDEDLYQEEGEEPIPPAEGEDKGIPDFWLTVLKSNGVTGELVQPHDEPILSKMTNARVVWRDIEPLGFTLEFQFAPNEYFSNRVLTKTYTMKFEPDASEPFSYDGPEICKSEGCKIDWYEGKNVTLKTVKKKQKHRRGAMTRIVTRSVKVQSFFNFFSPLEQKNEADKNEDDLEDESMDEDHEIGQFMKDKLIPMAVLFYTGEAEEDESILSEDESEEYDDTEEDDEIDQNEFNNNQEIIE